MLVRTGAGTVFLVNALILYWSVYRSLSLEGDAKGEHSRLSGLWARCAPESVMSDMLHRFMPF